jgi:hypothetical protein
MNAAPVGLLANQFALFLEARANYTQAEPLYRRALRLIVQSSRSLPRNPQTGALVKYQQNVPFCRVSAEKGGRWF